MGKWLYPKSERVARGLISGGRVSYYEGDGLQIFAPTGSFFGGVGGDGSAKVRKKDKRPNELARQIRGERGRDVFDLGEQWCSGQYRTYHYIMKARNTLRYIHR